MTNKNCSNILNALGRATLTFMFVFGQTAWAGQNPKDKPDSNMAAKSQKTPTSLSTGAAAKAQSTEAETTAAENPSAQENTHPGGQHEGIKVHGHWTIEVRNPDGTVVRRKEFENSLAGGGAFVLSTVLARTNSVGQWQINLIGPVGSAPCPGSVNVGDCIIQENGSPVTGSGIFNALTVATTTGAGGLNVLQLTGTATAGGNGQITAVQSFVNACAGGSCAPATAGGSITAGYLFTQAIIPPINVASGQTIAVTVDISFS